jgi:hypothetical protein
MSPYRGPDAETLSRPTRTTRLRALRRPLDYWLSVALTLSAYLALRIFVKLGLSHLFLALVFWALGTMGLIAVAIPKTEAYRAWERGRAYRRAAALCRKVNGT